MCKEPYWAEEASAKQRSLLSEFLLETWYLCTIGGRPQAQSMFIDLWKPTHKLLGTILNHSAADVNVKKVHVVLHEETVRQLKPRVRGGSASTLFHTVTVTSVMELVPDMWQ